MRRAFQRFFVPALFFVVLPIAAHASHVGDLLRTEDTQIVTRGDFIRAAVRVLELPAPKPGTTVPYARVPKSLLPTVTVAHQRGALGVFGSELLPGKSITRGEALVVLTRLLEMEASSTDTGYSDAPKTSPFAAAVNIAVGHHWVEPMRDKFFGVQRGLTGREARVILRKAIGEEESGKSDGVDQEPVISVRLKGKASRLPKEEMLQYIWDLIQDNYVNRDKVDQEKIADKLAQALMESLEDPYSIYMPPAPAQEFQSHLGQGEPMSGIGAQVEYKNNILTIVAPLPNSPAEKASLLAGDEIIAVDGNSILGLSFTEAVSKVRGPKGSQVRLRIRRSGNEFETSLIRDTIVVTDFSVTEQSGIPVLKLSQFGEMADRDLRTTFMNIAAKNPKGLIVDLRNNPGGLLHTANVFLSNFLPKGSVTAVVQSNDGEAQEVTDADPTIAASTKVVVLVNKGSASASELVAAALKDYKRATIVGETTFGKGSVQRFWEFTGGALAKLTIAHYFSPKKNPVDGVGVVPDIVIANAATADRDEAMLKAVELLR